MIPNNILNKPIIPIWNWIKQTAHISIKYHLKICLTHAGKLVHMGKKECRVKRIVFVVIEISVQIIDTKYF